MLVTWQPPLPGPRGEPGREQESLPEAKSDDRNLSTKAHASDTQETTSGPDSKPITSYFGLHSNRLR